MASPLDLHPTRSRHLGPPEPAAESAAATDNARGPEQPPRPPEPSARGPVFEWEAPAYEVRPKPLLWYAGFGVVLAVLLFIAFLTRSFLTGVVFLLLGILTLLTSERPPRAVRFSLSSDALTIGDRRYPLRELLAFNVTDSLTGSGTVLLLQSRRLVVPLIHVPLGDLDPETVRSLVGATVREDPELHESLADILAHRLGF